MKPPDAPLYCPATAQVWDQLCARARTIPEGAGLVPLGEAAWQRALGRDWGRAMEVAAEVGGALGKLELRGWSDLSPALVAASWASAAELLKGREEAWRAFAWVFETWVLIPVEAGDQVPSLLALREFLGALDELQLRGIRPSDELLVDFLPILGQLAPGSLLFAVRDCPGRLARLAGPALEGTFAPEWIEAAALGRLSWEDIAVASRELAASQPPLSPALRQAWWAALGPEVRVGAPPLAEGEEDLEHSQRVEGFFLAHASALRLLGARAPEAAAERATAWLRARQQGEAALVRLAAAEVGSARPPEAHAREDLLALAGIPPDSLPPIVLVQLTRHLLRIWAARGPIRTEQPARDERAALIGSLAATHALLRADAEFLAPLLEPDLLEFLLAAPATPAAERLWANRRARAWPEAPRPEDLPAYRAACDLAGSLAVWVRGRLAADPGRGRECLEEALSDLERLSRDLSRELIPRHLAAPALVEVLAAALRLATAAERFGAGPLADRALEFAREALSEDSRWQLLQGRWAPVVAALTQPLAELPERLRLRVIAAWSELPTAGEEPAQASAALRALVRALSGEPARAPTTRSPRAEADRAGS